MNSHEVLVYVLGSLMVLMVPTFATIMWKSWQKLGDTIHRNTIAIERLKGSIELIWRVAEDMPKMKKDVDRLFNKYRRGSDDFREEEM